MSESKTFCILPFVHLYAEPKGEMKPCCIAGGFDEPLNLKKMSIDEAFNSSQMKKLRKDMLTNKRNKVCDVCYKKEDLSGHSPRLDFNKNTLWELPEINSDYSVESQFQHIDARISNLCNFKCRMCNHGFSSNWYESMDHFYKDYTLNNKEKLLKVSDNFVQKLIPHLGKLKSIYFAGGEPLIMPEHYEILNYLYNTIPVDSDINSRRLSIHYNTNLSVIKYNENDLIELWKGFDRVFLSISCDGLGKVGEYQRKGFNTETLIKNLKKLKEHANIGNTTTMGSGITFGFQYTTTIWNCYEIFNFLNFMIENNFIESSSSIDFYYSWTPHETSLNNLSKNEKEKLINFLKKNLENIKEEKTINEINSIINFVNSKRNISPQTVVEYSDKMDRLFKDKLEDDGVDFYSMYLEIE